MRNRKLILVGVLGLFLLLVGFVVTSLLNRPKTISLADSYAVPDTFSTAVNYGDSDVLLANGRGLVSYDYRSGKATAVTPDLVLGGFMPMDSLAAASNKQYILFHTNSLLPSSILGAQLVKQRLDPNQPYWWVYNTQAATYGHLDTAVVRAQLSGSQLDGVVQQAASETLNHYDISTLNVVSTISIPRASNFTATANGYVLELPDGSVVTTKDGITSQVIARQATLVGATKDQASVLIASTVNGIRQLGLVDMGTLKIKTIASNVVQQPFWNGSDTVLYSKSTNGSTGDLQFMTYNIVTKKTSILKGSDALSGVQNKSAQIVALLGDRTVVVSKNIHSYFLAGPSIAALKLPSADTAPSLSINGASQLHYDAKFHIFTINKSAGAPADLKTQTYRNLTAVGYIPELFTIQTTEASE